VDSESDPALHIAATVSHKPKKKHCINKQKCLKNWKI
jgi:hypothetical protein